MAMHSFCSAYVTGPLTGHCNVDQKYLFPQHGMTAVHIAAKRANIEALKLLLDCSGNPNIKCEVCLFEMQQEMCIECIHLCLKFLYHIHFAHC